MAQGPLINAPALRKVERHVTDAVEGRQGADRRRAARARRPVLRADRAHRRLSEGLAIATRRTFGPGPWSLPLQGEEEAIALANDTETGLSACFYLQISAAWRVAEALEAGMVGINEV